MPEILHIGYIVKRRKIIKMNHRHDIRGNIILLILIISKKKKGPTRLRPPQVRMTKVDPRSLGTATSSLGFMTNSRNHVTMANANTKSSSWLVLAIASGACAAFNGVYAKLYASAFLTATHG